MSGRDRCDPASHTRCWMGPGWLSRSGLCSLGWVFVTRPHSVPSCRLISQLGEHCQWQSCWGHHSTTVLGAGRAGRHIANSEGGSGPDRVQLPARQTEADVYDWEGQGSARVLQESAEAWLKIPEDRGRNTLSTALGPGVFPCSHPRLCYNQAREQPWPQVSTRPAAAHRGRRDKDREGWRALPSATTAPGPPLPATSPGPAALSVPSSGEGCPAMWDGRRPCPRCPGCNGTAGRPAAGMAVPKLARGSCSPSCLGHCSLSLVPG